MPDPLRRFAVGALCAVPVTALCIAATIASGVKALRELDLIADGGDDDLTTTSTRSTSWPA